MPKPRRYGRLGERSPGEPADRPRLSIPDGDLELEVVERTEPQTGPTAQASRRVLRDDVPPQLGGSTHIRLVTRGLSSNAARRPILRDDAPPRIDASVDIRLVRLSPRRPPGRARNADPVPRHRDRPRGSRTRGLGTVVAVGAAVLLVVMAVAAGSALITARTLLPATADGGAAATAPGATDPTPPRGSVPTHTTALSGNAGSAAAQAAVDIVSPRGAATVPACSLVKGAVRGLTPRRTLVIATSDASGNSPLLLTPVDDWQDPASLRTWRARLVVDPQSTDRKVLVRVIEVSLAAVSEAATSHSSSWHVVELPKDAVQRDSVALTVRPSATTCGVSS